MPLLIPGLDEAAAKTFTKRLLKGLKSHPSTPSLTQLQTLVAQAIGHQDWHAAQVHWAQPSALPVATPVLSSAPKTLPIDNAKREKMEENLLAVDDLVTLIRQGSRGRAEQLERCLDTLSHQCDTFGLSFAGVLFNWAQERARRLAESFPFPDELDLMGLERQVLRARQAIYPVLFPERPLPVLGLVPEGLNDEDLFPPLDLSQPNLKEGDDQDHGDEMDHDPQELMDAMLLAEQMHYLGYFRDTHMPNFEKAFAAVDAQLEGPHPASPLSFSDLKAAVETLSSIEQKSRESRLDAYAVGCKARPYLDHMLSRLKWEGEPEEKSERLAFLWARARVFLLQTFFPERPVSLPPSPKKVLEQGATLVGDWALLEQSVALVATQEHYSQHRPYESHPAVHRLCQWWNTHAPAGQRQAGTFFVNVLSEGEMQTLGYEDGPPGLPEDMVASSNTALFVSPQGFHYVLQFLRGQEHNEIVDGGTRVFQADGQLFWEIGSTEVNESYYAITGLHDLHGDVTSRFRDLCD